MTQEIWICPDFLSNYIQSFLYSLLYQHKFIVGGLYENI